MTQNWYDDGIEGYRGPIVDFEEVGQVPPPKSEDESLGDPDPLALGSTETGAQPDNDPRGRFAEVTGSAAVTDHFGEPPDARPTNRGRFEDPLGRLSRSIGGLTRVL